MNWEFDTEEKKKKKKKRRTKKFMTIKIDLKILQITKRK
jgi:hypothetical protein